VSSAFLYVAIVAIWIFVLVPRWLRRQHAAPQPEYEADYAPGPAEYEDDDSPQDEAADDDAEFYAANSPGEPAVDARQYTPAPAAPPLSRSRVLQARRRLLTMLVLLATAAAACTALKLTAWWVCIPPAVMLGMYLLLLREAAIADAERERWRAELQYRADVRRERAYRVEQAAAEQPSAEVIDISGRVGGDMLYDQYADAAVRAVGD
jgi:hypothetical protein